MSEGRLSRLLRQLGLLARRDIVMASNGRILRGAIDAEVELLYVQVDEIHDQVLDGHPLNSLQVKFLEYCQQVIAEHRPIVRQLEAEFA